MDQPAKHADAPWRREYPFASRWLQLEQGAMHYVDESPARNSAGVVLFVHGNPTWSFHWRRLIAAAQHERRCVAVDHLGCGLSDKPARPFRLADRIEHLGRLVDELDLRDVTLVAQDWGGAIGLGAMLQRKDRLSALMLLNTGAWPPRRAPRRIAVCRTPVLGRLALQGGNLFSLAALRMTTEKPLDSAVRSGYLAPYNSWSNRRAVFEFVNDIPTGPSHPTWRTLAQIERRLPELAGLPIRLVWGMRDWCFDRACLERFCEIWAAAPDLRVRRLERAGHWVAEDAPEVCAAELTSLIAECDGPADPARADAGAARESV
ncbi:alpha/beta fold hydrolase [Botrimarina sp.]|uniref:alpha/beta fold hydrolase n=1 Tax=Botrimarina sp. TaxID=2795802 RepID=UPI0032EB2633